MPETQFKHHDVRFQRAIYADGGIGGGGLGASAFWFVKTTGLDANDGKSWATPKLTVQAAINAAAAGDVIYVGPGSYAEKVTINKAKLMLVGVGGKGAVAIAPAGANDVAILVDGEEDITLYNVGGEGKGTGGGLHIKATAKTRRFRAYDCKFEGGAFGCKIESTGADPLSVGDTIFQDCEFTWCTDAVLITVTGGGDPVTETRFYRCWFHDFTGVGIKVLTVATKNLWVEDCFFGDQQDGSQPTDFVLADVAGTTGFFAGNKFATPTNAAAVLTIAAGVHWSANATEAGWSTARPA